MTVDFGKAFREKYAPGVKVCFFRRYKLQTNVKKNDFCKSVTQVVRLLEASKN